MVREIIIGKNGKRWKSYVLFNSISNHEVVLWSNKLKLNEAPLNRNLNPRMFWFDLYLISAAKTIIHFI